MRCFKMKKRLTRNVRHMMKIARKSLLSLSAVFALCQIIMGQIAFASSSPTAAPMGQPHRFQMNLQEAATPMMEGLVSMHNMLLVIIALIAVFVTGLLIYVVYRYRASKNPIPSKVTHNTPLEIVWTLFPVIAVIIIMVPSVKLILEMEKPQNPEMTVKVIGKQWYWTYEYPAQNEKTLSFDSNMIEDKDLKPGQLRLLEVDNRVVVPVNTTVQLLITAGDVLHSFAVPALGIKKDAVPGRMNETWFRIKKEGVYYGQCSELCGIKHGYMPIAIEVVSKEKFKEWKAQKQAAH